MEPHPLWEYPCYPLSDVYEIFEFELKNSFDLNDKIEIKKQVVISFKNNGILNGIALWHSVDFEETDSSLNAGLLKEPEANKKLEWSRQYKQAVHILDKKYEINDSNMASLNLICSVNFKCKQGAFSVDFKIVK